MDTETILAELRAMRVDFKDDIVSLGRKVDHATEAIGAHELRDVMQLNGVDARLRPLEAVHRAGKWFIVSGVLALLGGVADFLMNHWR